MDKQKLKSEFHKLIDDFEDIETLENIYEGMKNIKNSNTADIFSDLTEEQVRRIYESREQVKQGKFLTHKQMLEEIKKWR